MAKQKVKFTVTHDRLAVVAKFENGDEYKASVSRGGERFTLAQLPSTPEVTKGEFEVLKSFMNYLPDETNQTRFERIAKTCEQAISISDLVKIISAK